MDNVGTPPRANRAPQKPATALTARQEFQMRENIILAGLRREIDNLKALLENEKDESIRESVDRVHSLFGETIEMIRSERLAVTVKAQSIQVGADAHSANKPLDRTSTHSWAGVAKKKAAPNAPAARSAVSQPAPKQPINGPADIFVDVGSLEEYPSLVQRVRKGTDQEVIGRRVVGVRNAHSGGHFSEVHSNATQVEAVMAEVARSAGPGVEVRDLVQSTTNEVWDNVINRPTYGEAWVTTEGLAERDCNAWNARAASTTTPQQQDELADALAAEFDNVVDVTCDEEPPRSGNVGWWTPEIAELRRRCFVARKVVKKAATRAANSGVAIPEENLQTLRYTRAMLKKAISMSKEKFRKEQLATVDGDP